MAAIEVKVPDIGDFKDIPVIELLVKPGDAVKKDDSLLVLESDKATMEVPAPVGGRDRRAEGQGRRQGERGRRCSRCSRRERRARGDATATAQAQGAAPAPAAAAPPAPAPAAAAGAGAAAPRARACSAVAAGARSTRCRSPTRAPACAASRASWACRLAEVTGSGPEGAHPQGRHPGLREAGARRRRRAARRARRRARRPGSAAVAQGRLRQVRPDRDASRCTRIQKISAPGARAQLGDDPARHAVRRGRHHRARGLPRAASTRRTPRPGIKVTPLAFLMKAVVAALKKYPTLNSSLDGENLILKQLLAHRLRRRHAARASWCR